MITLLLHLLRLSRGAAPAGGSPYYILPAKIPELTRPEDAVLVEAELSRGGDIVKLFTGSWATPSSIVRSEEHTSELQSQSNLVCRLLLEKKKKEEAECQIS